MSTVKTFSQALPILAQHGLTPMPAGNKLWSVGAMTYDKGGIILLARKYEQELSNVSTQLTTTTDERVLVGVPMMDASEARQVVTRIKGRIEEARRDLLELHDREGWRALGYSSWGQCAKAEFGGSAATLYRQLEAAEIARSMQDSQFENLPTSHLQAVKDLPPPLARQAIEQAYAHGTPTAQGVKQAADELHGTTPDDLKAAGVALTKHGSWFKATGYSGAMNGWASLNAEPWPLAVKQAREEIARRAAATPATLAPALLTVTFRHSRDRHETDLDDGLHQQLAAKGYTWESAAITPDGRWHHVLTSRNRALLRNDGERMRRERLAGLVVAAAAQPAPVVADDQALMAQIRSQAAALDLKVIWEDDRVVLYWPEEEDQLDQMDLLRYGAAIEWLTNEAPGAAERRTAFLTKTAPAPARPPAVPPRPRRPVSADVSAQVAYITQLEAYASALEAFIMALQKAAVSV